MEITSNSSNYQPNFCALQTSGNRLIDRFVKKAKKNNLYGELREFYSAFHGAKRNTTYDVFLNQNGRLNIVNGGTTDKISLPLPKMTARRLKDVTEALKYADELAKNPPDRRVLYGAVDEIVAGLK